jgi:hypothetical protein
MLLLNARTSTRRSGTSLIEMMIVITILVILTRSLLESSKSMSQMTESTNTRALLAEQAQEAISAIVDDFHATGIRTVNGVKYPYVYENGDAADGSYPGHDHLPALQAAVAGDTDFGVPHSMIFVLPSDLDSNQRPDLDGDLNGTPELDGDGDGTLSESAADTVGWVDTSNMIDAENGLVWSHDEFSYVTVPGADGINWLERRFNGKAVGAERIARDIELMTIETSADTGFQIPTNALRVRMFFRRFDPSGVLYRHRAEIVVTLRNGALEF